MRNSEAAKDFLTSIAEGVYHTKMIFVGAYFVDTPEYRLFEDSRRNSCCRNYLNGISQEK